MRAARRPYVARIFCVANQKGGRGQDDHRPESGRRAGPIRRPNAAGRSRSTVQRHDRPRAGSRPAIIRWSTARRSGKACWRPTSRGSTCCPAAGASATSSCSLAMIRTQSARLREHLDHRIQCLRFRADRLSAIARAAHENGAEQLHRGIYAYPMRVFRHGRADADDRSHSRRDAGRPRVSFSSAGSC